MAVAKADILSRFFLVDGQFFAEQAVRNVHWYLNDRHFGFGDLREANIKTIHLLLEPGEVFEGFHEAHLTQFQQRESPMIRINVGGVTFPPHVPLTEETRRKIKQL